MPSVEMLNKIYSSEYYNSFYPERNQREQKLLFQERLKKLESLQQEKKGKVLDIGCGRGVFIEAASERGWECVAQEFSQQAAADLRNRLGIDVVVCNEIAEAKFPSEYFDLVNLNHVLEHLYRPSQTLKEIYRIVKPGGLIYCEVPRQNNFLNLLSNIFGKKDFGFSYLPEHLFLFDTPSMKRLLNDSGFDLLEIKIEGLGNPHRYVRGIHYNSFWTHIIVRVVGGLRLAVLFGGGNLATSSRKHYHNENNHY